MKKIAMVITPLCPKSKKKYGLRIENIDGRWVKTWAFKLNPKSNEKFQGSVSLQDGLAISVDYNGCPYCNAKEFVQCGTCGNMLCFHGEDSLYCPECDEVLEVGVGEWDDVSGGGY